MSGSRCSGLVEGAVVLWVNALRRNRSGGDCDSLPQVKALHVVPVARTTDSSGFTLPVLWLENKSVFHNFHYFYNLRNFRYTCIIQHVGESCPANVLSCIQLGKSNILYKE